MNPIIASFGNFCLDNEIAIGWHGERLGVLVVNGKLIRAKDVRRLYRDWHKSFADICQQIGAI